jgi:hypothetical protein
MTRANVGAASAIAVAALVIGAVLGQPGNGRAAGGGAPSNTGPPAISGTPQEGQTLTASTGTWTDSPTSFAYAWSQCDTSGNSCAAISGAAAATYTVVSADVGHTLRVTVTATNANGSGQANSAQTDVVSGANVPKNTAAPAISGTLQVGSKLSATAGTWTGSPTSFAYAWSRCDAKGENCAKIGGATSNTYALVQADVGSTLRVTVTAANSDGSTQASSAATAVVPTPNGCPAGTGPIQIADLAPPARLSIDKASITPRLVTLGTRTIQLRFTVSACNGRPVQGATVFATPIPYNQFAGREQTTGSDGTITLTQSRLRGFPARSRGQSLLAVFVRASKPGEPILAGVSTRRTIAFRVNLP